MKNILEAFKAGTLSAFVVILLSALFWILGISATQTWVNIVSFAVQILVLLYFAIAFRKKKEQGRSFGQMFLFIFIAYLFYAIIYFFYNQIYITFMETDFVEIYCEKTLKTMKRLTSVSPEIEQRTIEQLENALKLSFSNFMKMLLGNIAIGVLIAAIFGAFLKNKKNNEQ